MTRVARKEKKSALPSTPWGILKQNKYKNFEDEDSDRSYYSSNSDSSATTNESISTRSKPLHKKKATKKGDLRDPESVSFLSEEFEETGSSRSPGTAKLGRVKKGQLKETRKTKLMEKVSKRLAKKLKHKLTTKQLKQKIGDFETLSLVSSSDTTSDETSKNTKKSLRKKKQRGTVSEHSTRDKETAQEGATSSSSSEVLGNEQKPLLKPGNYKSADEKRKKQNEARRLRRQKRKVCFNCRKSGHLVQNCPLPQSCGICFKCGSAEHTSRSCQVDTTEGDYPYAKCFICGETGHLSRSCPDNPKGLYPNGGCCKLCGSVEHLKSNCPDRIKKNPEGGFSSKGLVMMNAYASADAEDCDEIPLVASKSKVNGNKQKGKSRTKEKKIHRF